jgi:hypothetical protein
MFESNGLQSLRSILYIHSAILFDILVSLSIGTGINEITTETLLIISRLLKSYHTSIVSYAHKDRSTYH